MFQSKTPLNTNCNQKPNKRTKVWAFWDFIRFVCAIWYCLDARLNLLSGAFEYYGHVCLYSDSTVSSVPSPSAHKTRQGLGWGYLGQISGQNTVKEWSEHKIENFLSWATVEISCLAISMNYNCFKYYLFSGVIRQIWWQLAVCRETWVVIYAHDWVLVQTLSKRKSVISVTCFATSSTNNINEAHLR